jgi:alpha-1,2-mannosyltransferase
MAAATVAAIAIAPVSARARWLGLLLAGVMWPVSYAIKLGQVTPLLFLGFAVAWRFMERPAAVGVVGGLGGVLKIQPALVLGWALITGRWRAVVIGAAATAGAVLLTLPVTGIGPYADYVALLGRVSGAVDTPNNMSPGAVAYALGMDAGAAGVLQLAAMGLAVGLAVVAARRGAPEAGLLAAIVVSQVASPVLWSHYAVVLLLPIAWLLDRRQWWATAIPLGTSIPLVGVTPAAAYPIAFGAVLLALAWQRGSGART